MNQTRQMDNKKDTKTVDKYLTLSHSYIHAKRTKEGNGKDKRKDVNHVIRDDIDD